MTSQEKAKIVGGVSFLIFFGIGFFGVRYIKDFFYSDNISQDKLSTAEIVRQVKSELTLPQQLDEVTTLVDIKPQPNAIRYYYIISDVSASHLSNASLKTNILKSVCNISETRNLLMNNINLEYFYSLSGSTQTYFVTITKDDCQ